MIRCCLIVFVSLSRLPIAGGAELDKAPPEPMPFTSTERSWWREPDRNGSAAVNQQPPLTWSDSEHVLGKSSMMGRGHGSPTVVGHRVFLATADQEQPPQAVLRLAKPVNGTRREWLDCLETSSPNAGTDASNLARTLHTGARS